MTENNAAQPGQDQNLIESAIAEGHRVGWFLACPPSGAMLTAFARLLLSKLRAEGVQAGGLPAYINDDSQPLQYRLGWNNCLSDCRAALASAPVAGEATDADPTPKDQYRRMFTAACAALGAVTEKLGLDPDDAEPDVMLTAIDELIERAANAAPQASEAVRNARADGFIAGFICAGGDAEEAKKQAPQLQACIDACTPQADKDGGDCAKGAGDVLSNLIWAASERDKGNRIRQFDQFMDEARAAISAAGAERGQRNE
jgi:hypothetical protein